MLIASGTMRAGEAQGTMRAVQARMVGVGYRSALTVASFVIALTTTLGVYAALDSGVAAPRYAALVISAAGLAALFAYWRFNRYLLLHRFRRGMEKRHMPTSFKHKLTLFDDKLSLETEWVHSIAPWSSVTEVLRAGEYWIFLVGFEPWFAASRFFSSPSEERAFVAAAVAHLSPEAKQRSGEAVAFAEA